MDRLQTQTSLKDQTYRFHLIWNCMHVHLEKFISYLLKQIYSFLHMFVNMYVCVLM